MKNPVPFLMGVDGQIFESSAADVFVTVGESEIIIVIGIWYGVL